MTTLTTETAADLFRAAPDRWLDVGAGHAAYRRVGAGPDVLFVHGWPVSGATFRLLLPHLVDHATCHIIDLPGAGDSRFKADTPLSIDQHIETVRRVVELLGLDDVALVGQDSGGLIARHAMAGDARLRAMGLINSEQTHGLSRRLKTFLAPRRLPGFDAILGWAVSRPRIRRSSLLLGDCFVDPSLIDGEFDEFFLRPLYESSQRLDAAGRVLRTIEARHVEGLAGLHRQIDVPVQLVWGEQDPFFPVAWAHEMVDTFADARLTVVSGAGLFPHEERPAEVAKALLPTLTRARDRTEARTPRGRPASPTTAPGGK